jgi:hypothetical protein
VKIKAVGSFEPPTRLHNTEVHSSNCHMHENHKIQTDVNFFAESLHNTKIKITLYIKYLFTGINALK